MVRKVRVEVVVDKLSTDEYARTLHALAVFQELQKKYPDVVKVTIRGRMGG